MLYTPERLSAIAKEAGKPKDSLFTFEDRIGLINDSPALAKAGLVQLSSTLTLIDNFRDETESTYQLMDCAFLRFVYMMYIALVWESIAESLTTLVSTWWEHENIITHLNAFRRVSWNSRLYASSVTNLYLPLRGFSYLLSNV